MSRKKVAFIITNLGMGGAENMLVEQLRFINKINFEPWVIPITPNPQKNVLHNLPPDIKHVPFNFLSVFDLKSLYKLSIFLKQGKFDAVITGLFNANLLGRMAAILARVPMIFSYEHSVYPDKKTWQIIADRFLAKFTKRIIVGSKEVLEFTSKQQHLPIDKFVLNYNSIPLKLSRVKESRSQTLLKYNLPENITYIVAVGSLNPQKAHSYLIDAVSQMKKRGAVGFKVLIFGKGPLKEKLLKQIEDSDLAEEVKLMGISSVEEIMSISDIFTLPSLWEGLSIALLQAMDAKCPIVATRVSGTNEALKNEESALLVTPGNVSELSSALEKLLNNSELRNKLATKAHENVQRFSIEKNVKVIENLIWP